ncbi:mycofactocin system GMC family oxidoreductase MftG [Mycolicibacterium fluoranthenivorans]|uniref:Dehydrogenase, Rv0697 family n=1 Tax=Mycolicibacterium fluoranthenivorans TaxID=258505 RepID=A0A1G4WM95_9MYCO|nr:mycofactocin system GMC family oxidoreductase MftG [Mycolicibacterium fluoranthenivorans]SCX25666.1 dehydrogenase, Rv0697 family [Mycolicibacterium fluoranthenivorans]
MHSDVLIVGAGSAGSILAERLSVDERCKVTVLEVGPSADDPAVSAHLRDATRLPIGPGSAVVRQYATSLTDHPRRTATVMRGAVVGGSGAINGGYFCRGRAADFDGWNLAGWRWDDVLPHFRAIETDLDRTGPLHGAHGPVRVRRTAQLSPGTATFVQRGLGLGYPWLDDLNGEPEGAGVGAIPLNIENGIRLGPASVFLLPALSRPNLTVRSGVPVLRVLIKGARAVGVEVLGRAGLDTLTADRIVLSAGAIGSAQLLMVSGIGPADMLERAGITVHTGLPVGVAFCDHPEWVLPVDWPAAPGRPPVEAALYLGDLELRLYTTGFAEMIGAGPADRPHIGIALMRPQSRGRLSVLSADLADAPVIEHHYDGEQADVAALRHGAELAGEIAGVVGREAHWSTTQHLSGTAPMGQVLDERCRVHGIDGLWVVDGSVMPILPSRGPHATIAMIGHRAAEFIS